LGSLEFQIGPLESEKIIIGSLKSEKIGSLESEKSGPYKSITGFLTFSLKTTLVTISEKQVSGVCCKIFSYRTVWHFQFLPHSLLRTSIGTNVFQILYRSGHFRSNSV